MTAMLPHRPRVADRSAVFLKLYRLLNVIRAIPCGFDVSSDFPLVPSITEHIDDIDNRKNYRNQSNQSCHILTPFLL